MGELNGKVALVTGASRGIGRAIAVRLGRDGALVAVHYGTDEAAAKETVATIEEAGGRAFAVQAELGAADGVERLFEGLDAGLREHAGGDPGLDILVNNAGIGLPGTIEQVTPEGYDRVFAVNVRAPFFIVQAALPRLRDGGRVVNVTSGVSRIAFPEGIAYAMTKGALELLTLNLAKQLGPRGITVNSVAPGIIDTDVNADWLRGNAEAEAYAASRAALNRVGTPEEIADVVAFAVSPAGRFVTGTTLDATGGGNL
ncbi:SDR family oxidoreductase [Bailinhaonella thermotolerans]|uniref:SDR family oxidoreductase n=1 Tax=Bailinhaonella thermotolerans TaxID=1070861 RepID=A0A3A4AXX1_9ACTN|nr:SDR family oxidoreductase [Bailinhaonella thermotolerans]RJL33259.1 SDR family oxidoreductase [Bailinhaonella thermotolerans]